MPFRRRPGLLVFSEDEQRMLERLRKSRTEDKRRTVRAAILLDSFAGMSDQAIARAQRVNRNTVMRCIQKCLRFGVQGTKAQVMPPILATSQKLGFWTLNRGIVRQ